MQKKVEEMESQIMAEEKLPEIAEVKTKALTLTGGIIPKDFDELTRFASLVHKSGLAPKGFDGVEKVAIGMLTNMELGRPIITGLQDLAIINGRCGIYGDASLAMVTASGLMEEGFPKSEETGTPYTDDWTFKYTVKRIGRPEETGTWSWLDSKKAGFDAPKTKDGREDKWSPWTRFTRRMMQWKSRNFVMRDNFGDVLKGMKTVEDLHDLDPIPLKRQPNGSYSDESSTAADLTEKIKAENAKQEEKPGVLCPYCHKDIYTHILMVIQIKMNMFTCPYCDKEGKIENGLPIGSFPPDHTARNSGDYKDEVRKKLDLQAEIERKLEKDSTEEDSAEPKTHADLGKAWREKWINLRGPGFSIFFHNRRDEFKLAPSELKEEARAKWLKLYPDTPWPLTAPPKEEVDTEENGKRERMMADAEEALKAEIFKFDSSVINNAKIALDYNTTGKIFGLPELEALLKECKDIEAATGDDQRVSMIDAIQGSYKEEEIKAALVAIERASLSGCNLDELKRVYDDLREGEHLA